MTGLAYKHSMPTLRQARYNGTALSTEMWYRHAIAPFSGGGQNRWCADLVRIAPFECVVWLNV
jgi:hypothetical protein